MASSGRRAVLTNCGAAAPETGDLLEVIEKLQRELRELKDNLAALQAQLDQHTRVCGEHTRVRVRITQPPRVIAKHERVIAEIKEKKNGKP
jgi:hypothetical protein